MIWPESRGREDTRAEWGRVRVDTLRTRDSGRRPRKPEGFRLPAHSMAPHDLEQAGVVGQAKRFGRARDVPVVFL